MRGWTSLCAVWLLSACGSDVPDWTVNDEYQPLYVPPGATDSEPAETAPSRPLVAGEDVVASPDLMPERLTDGLHLTTPEEVAAACTTPVSVPYLWISGDLGPAGLEPLACVHEVREELVIEDTSLERLTGLENIESIGALVLDNNPELRSLEALSTTRGPLSVLKLTDLPALESLAGLDSIGRVDDRVELVSLPSLATLEGLDSLVIDDARVDVTVSDCPSLRSLVGLGGLVEMDDLTLEGLGIHTLRGLGQLRDVDWLTLTDLPALESLDGLDAIHAIDYLRLFRTGAHSLEGLDTLRELQALHVVDSLMRFDGATRLLVDVARVTLRDVPRVRDLQALSGVASIGVVDIEDAPSLLSLHGLESVEDVDRLSLVRTGVVSLDALSSLASAGDLELFENTALESIDALSGLEEVEDLIVRWNPRLTSVEGLSSVNKVQGDLWVLGNSRLTGLGSLTALETVSGDVDVRNNPGFSDDDAWALVDGISVRGTVVVSGNGG